MKRTIFLFTLLSIHHLLFSQNTGIGTATPAAKLEIKGVGTTSATTPLQVINNNNIPLFNVKDNGEVNVLSGNLIVNSSPGSIIYGIYPSNYWYTATNVAGRDFQWWSNNTTSGNNIRLYFDGSNGNLGIGTFVPADKLEVAGNINFSGTLKPNGTSGNSGAVLTSNGSSAPSWQTIQQNPAIGFIARPSADVAVPNFTYTLLTGFTETTDDGNAFDAATGVFTAPSAGMYHFDILINWGPSSPAVTNAPSNIRFFKGASVIAGGQPSSRITTDVSYGSGQSGSINIKLTAGETISVQVQQVSGGALNIAGGGGSTSSSFSGYKVY